MVNIKQNGIKNTKTTLSSIVNNSRPFNCRAVYALMQSETVKNLLTDVTLSYSVTCKSLFNYAIS